MRNLIFVLVTFFSINMTLAQEAHVSKLNLSITGMKCGGCENKVKSILAELPGVISVEEVDATEGTASLTIDIEKTSAEQVSASLADKSGYDVQAEGSKSSIKGNSKASCCTKGKKAACKK